MKTQRVEVKCDRCGKTKLDPLKNEYYRVQITSQGTENQQVKQPSNMPRATDLCYDCVEELRQWFIKPYVAGTKKVEVVKTPRPTGFGQA